jgi:hypothetical protein
MVQHRQTLSAFRTGCLAGGFRQREFRLAQKTAIGFKGYLRAIFGARNFKKNLGPIGLGDTQKPAFCHVCDKAAKRWSLVLALFLSGCLSVHNPLVAQLKAQTAPTLNLVFLGDSLTEGVPHFNGETDTMPFMVNEQFPGRPTARLPMADLVLPAREARRSTMTLVSIGRWPKVPHKRTANDTENV